MADLEADLAPARPTPARRRTKRPITYVLRWIVIAYLFFLVAWPVSLVAQNTFEDGTSTLTDLFDDPDIVHALRLTVVVALSAVVINTVFGVGMSLLLVRYQFRGSGSSAR